jgi:hypothetical protein
LEFGQLLSDIQQLVLFGIDEYMANGCTMGLDGHTPGGLTDLLFKRTLFDTLHTINTTNDLFCEIKPTKEPARLV